MRILFIASILAFTTVGISEDVSCRGLCPLDLDPACGYDEKCNFQGDNRCAVRQEECLRMHFDEYPPFKSISSGECPNDKPRCSRTEF